MYFRINQRAIKNRWKDLKDIRGRAWFVRYTVCLWVKFRWDWNQNRRQCMFLQTFWKLPKLKWR